MIQPINSNNLFSSLKGRLLVFGISKVGLKQQFSILTWIVVRLPSIFENACTNQESNNDGNSEPMIELIHDRLVDLTQKMLQQQQ